MARTLPPSPVSIMADLSAARIAPQISLIRTGGFSSPPVENMDSTKAVLTMLVIRNRKAAATVTALVRKLGGMTATAVT